MIPRLWVISRSAVSKFAFRSARIAEDLRLDDHVERRRRLVGDQQLRAQHERERDHDPLPHPARELVRVLAEAGRRDPHRPEHLERAPADLGVLADPGLVPLQRLARSDPRSAAAGSAGSSAPGRSGRARGRAACAAPSATAREVPAAVAHLARRRALRQQPEHAAAERRLAAAGLADEPERLALADLERDAVDRPHRAARPSRTRHADRARRRRSARAHEPPSLLSLRRSVGVSAAGKLHLRLDSGACCGARSRVDRLVQPSPSSVMPVTRTTIASPGNSPVHQMPVVASESARWTS